MCISFSLSLVSALPPSLTPPAHTPYLVCPRRPRRRLRLICWYVFLKLHCLSRFARTLSLIGAGYLFMFFHSDEARVIFFHPRASIGFRVEQTKNLNLIINRLPLFFSYIDNKRGDRVARLPRLNIIGAQRHFAVSDRFWYFFIISIIMKKNNTFKKLPFKFW